LFQYLWCEGVDWFRKAAVEGDAEAQCRPGVAYRCGVGVAYDYEKADRLCFSAAEQGNPHAQFRLGALFGELGESEEAVIWFRKAAEQDQFYAQCVPGDLEGEIDHFKEAVDWYRMAAEQGFAVAQFRLYEAYFYGRGVAADRAEAVKWLR
jgi:TPR repeat protein